MDRLLFIDDEACIRAAMSEYFSGLGYDVDCAEDEYAAQAMIEQHWYRIVVTDLRLSRSDRIEGLEILACVRRRAPQTDCVVLTAHHCTGSTARALREGAIAVLQKPQPLAALAAVIAARIAARNAAAGPDGSRAAAAWPSLPAGATTTMC